MQRLQIAAEDTLSHMLYYWCGTALDLANDINPRKLRASDARALARITRVAALPVVCPE